MHTHRPRQGPAHPLRRTSVGAAFLLVFSVACAAIAGLSAAGEDLEEAGYEVHDLLMEGDDSVYADLELPDGATDVEHLERAAAIIWDHLEDEAQQVEIRLRSPGDTDEIVTYSVDDLQRIHDEVST